MMNGSCRMHCGKSNGAPKGNRNALKHGNYPAGTQALLVAIKYLLEPAWERPQVVKRIGTLLQTG